MELQQCERCKEHVLDCVCPDELPPLTEEQQRQELFNRAAENWMRFLRFIKVL